MKGYMTVEASLVLPMVFGAVLFVLSLLFYSYDRCLLEQDVTAFVVRAEYLKGDTLQEKTQSVEQELREWYLDKYVWVDVAVRELMVKEDYVQLKADGDFTGPYFEKMTAERRVLTLSPAFLLRQKIKIEERMENQEEMDDNGIY